jgi:hypothetical protein
MLVVTIKMIFFHNLTSDGYIQLVDANLVSVDLLCPMRLSLLV